MSAAASNWRSAPSAPASTWRVPVMSAPLFYGRTDAKGAWVAQNAPEGAYRIKLWHPLFKEPAAMLERPVRLGGDGSDILVKLDQPLRPAALKAHPRSWDY